MKHLLLFFLFITIITTPSLFSQQKRSLNESEKLIQWSHSEGADCLLMPDYFWTKSGKLIFMKKKSAILRELTPETGKEKNLINLTTFFKQNKIKRIKNFWPDKISGNGRYFLYKLKGTLVLADIQKNKTTKISSQTSEIKCVSFSPDNQKIAFVRNNDLYVYNIGQKTEHKLTDDGSENILNGTLSWIYWEEIAGREDRGYWWSPDSQKIAFLRFNESPVGVKIFKNFSSRKNILIKQRFPAAGTPNPITHLCIRDLNSKQIFKTDKSETAYEYILRVKWSADSSILAFDTLNRMQTRRDIYTFSPSEDKLSKIYSETDSAWISVSDDIVPENNGELIIASEKTGHNHLYRINKNKKLTQLTRGNWSIFSSGREPFWVNKSIQGKRGDYIFFTSLKKSHLERHLYRLNIKTGKIQRISRERGTHKISMSPDCRFYIDNHSRADSAPELYVCTNTGKRIKQLSRETLPSQIRNLQTPEIFKIKARDGFMLPASLLKPADFDPHKKYPVITYVYGGPMAPTVRDYWDRSILFENALLKSGFLVFRVDNRSATGISKTLAAEVLNNLIYKRELNDLTDGIRWLKSQSFIDKKRVGIWGWSGGGAMTLAAMTGTEEFKAGIAGAATTSWYNYSTKLSEMFNKTPEKNPEGYIRTDLVTKAHNLHGKLMLMHGTYDDNVHPQHMWEFVNQLIQHKIVFEMQVYPMRKHGFTDKDAQLHRDLAMLDFWKRRL